MSGLYSRFGNEQHNRHGAPLTWPGTGLGRPIRGQHSGMLRANETESIPHRLFYHAYMFRMWEKEEAEAYVWVMERIANGWFLRIDREKIWDSEKQQYAIWLEWCQVYGVLPENHPAKAPPANGFA